MDIKNFKEYCNEATSISVKDVINERAELLLYNVIEDIFGVKGWYDGNGVDEKGNIIFSEDKFSFVKNKIVQIIKDEDEKTGKTWNNIIPGLNDNDNYLSRQKEFNKIPLLKKYNNTIMHNIVYTQANLLNN